MPLGTNNIIASEVTSFVPDLWSDEVVSARKANLVVVPLVRQLSHRGKKGDTIKIPTPSRGNASAKAAENQVTLIDAGTDATVDISINKHKEYSRLIEDLVSVQALESLRRFYTDDGGYAIAVAQDLDTIAELAATGNGGTAITITAGVTTGTLTAARIGDDSAAWDRTANTNAGNATDVTDAGIRSFIKRLDDANAPMAGRVFVVPTVVKQDMLGFSRYTEQAFTGEMGRSNSIRNGLVGDVYGVEIYVTTQLPSVQDAGTANDQKLALFFQKDAVVFASQLGVRSQTQYKQEWLADLLTFDAIYGVKTLRSDHVVAVVVPSTAT